MEDWVHRALERWPNVPALYGWLSLDRRGQWRIRGELITRPQIIDTINRNYAADERGCWYFQNGPQRGYMRLDYAPLLLRADGDALLTHTGLPVSAVQAVFLDEEGSLLLQTEHGPGLFSDADLPWALARLQFGTQAADEAALLEALNLPSGTVTPLCLRIGSAELVVQRLDAAAMPAALGFVRDPQPPA